MKFRCLAALPSITLIVAGLLTGCTTNPSPVAGPEVLALPVSTPILRDVTDYVDFTGRTDPVQAVDIRARVTGYLEKMPFKEGAEVKQGEVLFEIDRRPYQAQHDQAQGQVALAQAQLKLAKQTLARDQAIAMSSPGAVSRQQLDQDLAAVDEAEARVKAYLASMEVYKLNLGYTKVTSPIDGQVSRYYFTSGNLVVQDQTLLTTVVSLDPMYAYFDMDEPTRLRIDRAINAGKITAPVDGKVPVYMGLQGEDGFPHAGRVDFVNNQLNPTTGSISVRGVFPNPKPERGVRLLRPGMFVRIHMPLGAPHPALLVIDRAIASDQGLKYVYVLDADNKVQYRRVSTGALQNDGLRVINDGLKPEDRIVVGGLQQVRPSMQIRPELIPMPSLGQPLAPPPPAKDSGKKEQPKQ
ncbi:MAG: efflux RND transporter periplasmic adaptor subunit [Gemmataceae bacterium]|nr:efflux RND transporter periplasmic adaptor subunit [Gemmataceae bacterium]